MSKKNQYSDKVNPITGLPILEEENKLPFRPKHGLIYWVIARPAFLLSRVLFPAKVSGRENLPKKGGYVVAFNHISNLDAVTVSATVPRKLFFLAKIELSHGLPGIFLNGAGTIPVDRSRKNSEALAVAIEVLKNGDVVAIAPEGKTNVNYQLAPFKFGAVVMAARAKVPIIPTVINGKYSIFRRKVSITYGKPIRIDLNDLESGNEKLWYTINRMREKIRTDG